MKKNMKKVLSALLCVCLVLGMAPWPSARAAERDGGNTMTIDGTHSFACTDCGTTVTEGHSGGTAACIAKAVCDLWGASYSEADVDAHSENTTIGQTCMGYQCIHCGEWYGEADADAHSENTAIGQTCMGYQCIHCGEWYGEADPEAHSGGTAACIAKAVCALCGASYGEADADAHSENTAIGQTCMGYQCIHCGEWYGEADADAHSENTAIGQTCMGYQCIHCGEWYGEADPDTGNHAGPYTPEFRWSEPDDGQCYVDVYLYCDGCKSEYAAHSDYGYATLTGTVPPTDCATPGAETYTVSIEIDGETYTDTEDFPIYSYDHPGYDADGFCTKCGGYQMPELDPGEDAEWAYDDIYLVRNAGQLFWVADYVNNVTNEINVKLMNDIVVPAGKTWTPILNFYGTFDGNFKTVSGLKASGKEYVAMFGGGGYSYGTIRNLHLTNSTFTGTSYVGGIAGYFAGTIENCYVTNVTVTGENSTGLAVGDNAGTVRNCYAYGSNCVGYYHSSYATVENCYYLSETETEDGGKTAAQFASGEVAFLLQSGVPEEDIYDEEGNWVGSYTPEIWGQTVGEDAYPVLGGAKLYKVTNCKGEIAYRNTNENSLHIWTKTTCTEAKTCTVCGATEGEATGHSFGENGICGQCGDYQPAQCNDNGVYEIYNAGHLFWFAQQVNGGNSANLILMNDIDLENREWTPMGTVEYPFSGVVDGNGYEIINLYISKDADAVGFIGEMQKGGVKDLTVSGIICVNNAFDGGLLVAHMTDSGLYNCYTSGSISVEEMNTQLRGYTLGGILGEAQHGIVLNCGTDAEITLAGDVANAYAYVGGVAGYMTAGYDEPMCILNSYSNSQITVTQAVTSQVAYVGGIVGVLKDDAVNNYFGGSLTVVPFGSVYVGYAFGDASSSLTVDSVTYELLIEENYCPADTTGVSNDTVSVLYFTAEELAALSGKNALVTRLNGGLERLAEVVVGHAGYITASEWAELFAKFGGESCSARHWVVKDGKPVHCTTQMEGYGPCPDCGLNMNPIVDESITILHTLDLESDISISFVVPKTALESYDSCYLKCVLPEYEGNTQIGTSTVRIQPVVNGNYYYFTLTGITAVRMGDMVEAVLHMTKDGARYISKTDSYSVATYAYGMLSNTKDTKMLTLCADLLRYGTEAQSFKGYRTDALVDANMTATHRSYLSNPSALSFTATDSYLGDLENPTITWVGKTLDLASKVGLKFVFNIENYTGNVENLQLRVTYPNSNGIMQVVYVLNAEVYNAANGYYSFTYYGLLASQLRTVVDVAIYDGDTQTQISETLRYSAETYASKTGGTTLEPLTRALFAYSDSAKAYFTK